MCTAHAEIKGIFVDKCSDAGAEEYLLGMGMGQDMKDSSNYIKSIKEQTPGQAEVQHCTPLHANRTAQCTQHGTGQ